MNNKKNTTTLDKIREEITKKQKGSSIKLVNLLKLIEDIEPVKKVEFKNHNSHNEGGGSNYCYIIKTEKEDLELSLTAGIPEEGEEVYFDTLKIVNVNDLESSK